MAFSKLLLKYTSILESKLFVKCTEYATFTPLPKDTTLTPPRTPPLPPSPTNHKSTPNTKKTEYKEHVSGGEFFIDALS